MIYHVGYSGSRKGMTEAQKPLLATHLELSFIPGAIFHHGDCIGGDEEAAAIARGIGYYIVGHPPINDSKRAWFASDEECEPKDYLVRNVDIVDASDEFVATPGGPARIQGGGTWFTIRQAQRRSELLVTVVLPNGLQLHSHLLKPSIMR